MLFNSFAFLVFFPTVLVLHYWARRSVRAQNRLLLAASYIFYAWWDWRFLGLILLSTLTDYVIGLRIHAETLLSRRRRLLGLSLAVNLGVLGFFKYFGFFVESLTAALRGVGIEAGIGSLNIVLPVGISFYTFQTLSYTVDIYRGRLAPARSLRDFALFVAFFPQLVAGPIERARNLLPQFERARTADPGQLDSGLFLILWGLFKKVVIADNVAVIADQVFGNAVAYHGMELVVAALAFTVQIYCDFSGYSDIARGTARLLGFELMLNFRLPYFATDPSDFWKRWHISLSTWLRDYLYVGLGGNRVGKSKMYRNLLLTMVLGGLWHGAAWTFVAWGTYHGVLLVAFKMMARGDEPRRISRATRIGLMFWLTVVGWILFRAPDVATITHFLTNSGPGFSRQSLRWIFNLSVYAAPLMAIQVWQARTGNLLAPLALRWPSRAVLYGGLISGLLVLAPQGSIEFIYFQF